MKSISNVKISKSVDRAIFSVVILILIFAITVRIDMGIIPSAAPSLIGSSASLELCAAVPGNVAAATEFCKCVRDGKAVAECSSRNAITLKNTEGVPPKGDVGRKIVSLGVPISDEKLAIIMEEVKKSGIDAYIEVWISDNEKVKLAVNGVVTDRERTYPKFYRYVLYPTNPSDLKKLTDYIEVNPVIIRIIHGPRLVSRPKSVATPIGEVAVPSITLPPEVARETPGSKITVTQRQETLFVVRTLRLDNTYQNNYKESFIADRGLVVGFSKVKAIKVSSGGKILTPWITAISESSLDAISAINPSDIKKEDDLISLLEKHGDVLCDAKLLLGEKSPGGFTYAKIYTTLKNPAINTEEPNEWKYYPDPNKLESAVKKYEDLSGYSRDSWVCYNDLTFDKFTGCFKVNYRDEQNNIIKSENICEKNVA